MGVLDNDGLLTTDSYEYSDSFDDKDGGGVFKTGLEAVIIVVVDGVMVDFCFVRIRLPSTVTKKQIT